MKRLEPEYKHILKLIERDQNAEGWVSVSNVLYPILRKAMPEELVVSRGKEDGYEMKLTEEGMALIKAMKRLE